MAAILALAVQTAPAAAPVPERFSILVPPASDCPNSAGTEIIVCGRTTADPQRLPLPDERAPPDRPRRAVNDPRGALENAGRPCPPGGCTGVDLLTVPVVLIRGLGALIDPHSCCENGEGKDPMALARDVGRAFRKKPDKSGRVPIVLDEPARVEGATSSNPPLQGEMAARSADGGVSPSR